MDRSLLLDGTPWWVNVQFSSGTFSKTELVKAKFNSSIITNLDGSTLKENNRLIILGIAYNFHALANSGVKLYWQYSTGTDQKTLITEAVAGSNNANVSNGYETFIPGMAGRILSGTARAPASLYLEPVGTVPVYGHFKVWGIHVDANWRIGKQYDSSISGMVTTLDFNTAITGNN